jgi:hypothetical protein
MAWMVGEHHAILRAVARTWTLCLAACAALLTGCAPSDDELDYLAQKALLERQNQGIRELIQEEERGSLVPRDRFLIGIDESVVGDLFRSQLPIEKPLGKRIVVHLERATISLRDKFGVITIEGYANRRATPDRMIRIRIHGGLGKVSVDPKTDLLHVKIAIDRIEILEAGLLEGVLGRGGKALLARKGLPRIQEAIPELEVPVVLGRSIHIPAIQEEGFQLDSLVVPLDLSVERVIAAGGKLWVTLDAKVGKVLGGEEGVGVRVQKKPKKKTGAS